MIRRQRAAFSVEIHGTLPQLQARISFLDSNQLTKGQARSQEEGPPTMLLVPTTAGCKWPCFLGPHDPVDHMLLESVRGGERCCMEL